MKAGVRPPPANTVAATSVAGLQYVEEQGSRATNACGHAAGRPRMQAAAAAPSATQGAFPLRPPFVARAMAGAGGPAHAAAAATPAGLLRAPSALPLPAPAAGSGHSTAAAIGRGVGYEFGRPPLRNSSGSEQATAARARHAAAQAEALSAEKVACVHVLLSLLRAAYTGPGTVRCPLCCHRMHCIRANPTPSTPPPVPYPPRLVPHGAPRRGNGEWWLAGVSPGYQPHGLVSPPPATRWPGTWHPRRRPDVCVSCNSAAIHRRAAAGVPRTDACGAASAATAVQGACCACCAPCHRGHE